MVVDEMIVVVVVVVVVAAERWYDASTPSGCSSARHPPSKSVAGGAVMGTHMMFSAVPHRSHIFGTRPRCPLVVRNKDVLHGHMRNDKVPPPIPRVQRAREDD